MARTDAPFTMRFPGDMRDRLKVLAALNRRSMNAEVILAIEAWLAHQKPERARSNDVASHLEQPAQ